MAKFLRIINSLKYADFVVYISYGLIFSLLLFILKAISLLLIALPSKSEELLLLSLLLSLLTFYFTSRLTNRFKRNKKLLSPRELEVLGLLQTTKRNSEIADELFISKSTLKTHINSIYKKLKVSSRKELHKFYIK